MTGRGHVTTRGMDPWAQYLASAGFCCVQVNYRGSRGFGKEFRAAGDGQWSLAMQDDLIDALRSEQVASVTEPGPGRGHGAWLRRLRGADARDQQQVPMRA